MFGCYVNSFPRRRGINARVASRLESLLSKLSGGSRHHSQQQQQHQQQSDSYDHFWYNLTNKNVLYNYNALLTVFCFFFFLILRARRYVTSQDVPIWSYAMLHLNCIFRKNFFVSTMLSRIYSKLVLPNKRPRNDAVVSRARVNV